MRHIAKISIVLFGLTAAACGGKGLSKDQCQKIIDKGIELEVGGTASPEVLEMAKKAAGDQMKDALESCQKEASQSDYDCVMNAKTKKDFDACANK